MIIVTADPAKRLVRAVMSGLLTTDEVAAFSHDEQAAVRSMGLGTGEFLLLIETYGDIVQTQEVMNAFHQLVVNSPLKAKRIATVRSGALTTLQSRRVTAVRENSAVFGDVDSAREWLFASDG